MRFFKALATPALDEDTKRKKFILDVLLVSSIVFFSVAMLISIIASILHPESYAQNAVSLFVLLSLLAVLLGCYTLSQRGIIRPASLVLLSVFFLMASYMAYQWGIQVQAGLLFFVLLIVMTGVLVSARSAFGVVFATTVVLGVVGYLQHFGAIQANTHWQSETAGLTDVIAISLFFLVIATVSWLSNREIEKSLARARSSESDLKKERDMLEERVAERTVALREAEMEKVRQMYRFVEFGRLSSGLFHDLMNPLTALSLNIESIAHMQRSPSSNTVALLADDVLRAQRTTAHMQQLMESMRKHLSREGVRELFSVTRAAEETVKILSSYARAHQVMMTFPSSEDVWTYGDAVAFGQVMTNLISNAIEAYAPIQDRGVMDTTRKVVLTLLIRNAQIEVTIQDWGAGMSAEVQEKIFEPFFTTKEPIHGLGIGLSLAQRVIEKEFGGELLVTSAVGEGSTFTLRFDRRDHDKKT